MGKLQQKQELQQKLSPQQLLQARLFQLNTFSLEQHIYHELEKNPLLELSDPIDEESDYEDKEDEALDDFEIEELYSTTDDFELGRSRSSEKQSFESFNVDKNDTIDNLKEQLRDLNLDEIDMQIAHEIVGNLDNKGYLSIDPNLIADRYNIDIDKIVNIKDKIRLLDPPGMASSNIKECLLSQLVFHDFQDSHAYQIIDQYFEDFSKANYSIIQDKLSISKEQVKESLDIISNLSLYPGDGMHNLAKETILPDLIMEKRDDVWVITTNDGLIPEVVLNATYSDMINDKKVVSKTKTFIKTHYQNATLFLDAIKERKKTMLKVMHTIVDKQPDFFNSDKKILQPMLLKDIAESLELDLSTISRICNGKYVQLPFGLFELRSFFSEGIKMKDGRFVSNTLLKSDIIEIIKEESVDAPLKDEDIVKILDKKGYQIARRTITKYRETLNIPNSIMRKKIKGL